MSPAEREHAVRVSRLPVPRAMVGECGTGCACGAVGRVLGLQAVYVFGSAARGDMTSESDVDLAVLADRSLDPVARWHIQERIAAKLGRDVGPGRSSGCVHRHARAGLTDSCFTMALPGNALCSKRLRSRTMRGCRRNAGEFSRTSKRRGHVYG